MIKVNGLSVITIILLISCGNSTGPSGSEVSPSTLSVTFTGSTDGVASGPAHCAAAEEGGSPDGAKSICRVTASWTMCTDQGFDSYVLYRSESPGIQSNPSSAVELAEIDDRLATLFTDESVTWDTGYYYALRTTDTDGNGAWSNEAPITTPEVGAPTPSALTLAELTWEYAELSWSSCPEPNFGSYRLYRSLFPEIEDDTSMADLLCEIDWKLDTTFADGMAAPSTTYYYALLTTNSEDVSSWSNEIEVLTYDPIPDSTAATVIVGRDPWDAVSTPIGDYVYVTSRYDNLLSVIRTGDSTVWTTVPVGDSPYGICVLPSGEYVYTANWGSGDVSVVRTSDNTVVGTISVGNRPVGICSLPSGEFVYVTNRDDNSVCVIRTSDNTVADTVTVGTDPYRVCPLPSGDYVYVTNFGSNDMSVIRTSDNTVVDTVDLFTHPTGICSLPSGDYVFVSNYNNDVVAVVRTSDNTIVDTINVGNGPWGLCAHPNGECVYVANSSGNTISLIRTSDNSVVAVLDMGSSPSSICSTPSGTSVYVVNYGDGTVSVLQ
jgi:YVTN family beta-propeller protein